MTHTQELGGESFPDSAPRYRRLEELFKTHRNALVKASMRIVGSLHQAEDVVQEAFVKLEAGPRSTAIRSESHYLFQIVHNLSIDCYRRRIREERVIVTSELEADSVAADGTPETRAVGRQSLQALANALSELPERTRRAFELCRVQGMSQKDIAAELGVSPTLVNFMVKEALLHCRLRLKR